MDEAWVHPFETGVVLLALLTLAVICGTIDDYVRKRKEEKHLNSIINDKNNDTPCMPVDNTTGKIIFNPHGTHIPGGKQVKYKSSMIYRLNKNNKNNKDPKESIGGTIIEVDIIKSK